MNEGKKEKTEILQRILINERIIIIRRRERRGRRKQNREIENERKREIRK